VSARRAVGLDAVPGVRVGHWTGETTGVTVVLCPPGTTGSAEVRGGAPATRELAVLEPGRTVDQVDAVVLTGGSVFGLAAADAVVAWLAEHGLGFPTRFGPVPIVPAAAIYDLVRPRVGVPPGPQRPAGLRSADESARVAARPWASGAAPTARCRAVSVKRLPGWTTPRSRHWRSSTRWAT
jgi:hypothetical protein